MKNIQSVLRSLRQSPLKSFLTLFTVGLGVGVLIFAISISTFFAGKMRQELREKGTILTLANAAYTEENGLDLVMPPQFDSNVVDVVTQEVSGIKGVTPLTGAFWNEFIANGKRYRIRNVMGTNEQYQVITGMNILLGSFFTAQDLEKGNKVAIISFSLATILFGSPEEALGKTVTPPSEDREGPGRMSTRTAGTTGNSSGSSESGETSTSNFRRPRITQPTYKITGIFEDFSELKRKAYGLADFVVPYTSIFPAEMDRQMALRFISSRLILNVEGSHLKQTESLIRSVLTRTYGEGIELHLWEGTLNGESTILEETRQSINTFALVVNLLGFLLLITGSIGILSIMLVEVLGRSRDIALERAIGASKNIVIKEYFNRGLFMTSASVLLGIVLSIAFASPLKDLVLPIFDIMGDGGADGNIIALPAVLISASAALIIGGVFGVLPLFSALNTPISESLREE